MGILNNQYLENKFINFVLRQKSNDEVSCIRLLAAAYIYGTPGIKQNIKSWIDFKGDFLGAVLQGCDVNCWPWEAAYRDSTDMARLKTYGWPWHGDEVPLGLSNNIRERAASIEVPAGYQEPSKFIGNGQLLVEAVEATIFFSQRQALDRALSASCKEGIVRAARI